MEDDTQRLGAPASAASPRELSVSRPQDLCFGVAPRPLACGRGLVVGGGRVYPELNFTLPVLSLEPEGWQEARAHYEQIGAMIGPAAKRLRLEGLMVEFELLPPMTENPAWGAEITPILRDALDRAHDELGIGCALRVTPIDPRDRRRPPRLRTGEEWEQLCASLEACARAGADVLSIESVGGKEVHDEALINGDIQGCLFALGVLAARDMEWLWRHIVDLSAQSEVVAGADSACGFANTAMQLASLRMLPEVLAGVIRAAAAPRSLVAYRMGALGPSKDCAYEGPVLKAITGTPISMEGKSASCAHFSPVGNIAAAMCDLWSNESVQDVRLLSGSAPEAFLEILGYDCRLFNQALDQGLAREYQALLVGSDVRLSPQALVLTPTSTLRIAAAIVGEPTPYRQTVAAAEAAVAIMRDAVGAGELELEPRELDWLARIEAEIDACPRDEDELLETMSGRYRGLFARESYGL